MFELLFEAVMALVLLGFMILGSQIPAISSPNDVIEARGFPMIFSAIGLILLAAEMISQIRKLKKEKAEGKTPAPGKLDMKQSYKIAIIVCMTIAYILFVKYTGFVVFSVVFAFVALNLLESKNQVFNAVFSIGAILLLTLIFGRFFGISLPRGQGILKALSFYLY
ncbi:MAG: tripartite tricarboxylate transporter TctB family protein [Faecousia sp.]